MPQALKKKRSKKQRVPVVQLLLSGSILLGVVGVSVLLANFVQTAPVVVEDIQQPTAEPFAEALPLTPVPNPTLTPTPAIYAPFGAQYGFGGEDLIPVSTALAEEEEIIFSPLPTSTPTATSIPTSTPVKTLKSGMDGADVKSLQERLIELKYLDGTADGIFGKQTEDAVIMFQAINGLTADGLAGAKTLSVLYSASALSADFAPKTDFLILVNRQVPLDQNYVPSDLVEIEKVLSSDLVKVKYKGTKANRSAVEALGQLFQAAVNSGISKWQISSAYRTYKEQQKLVDNSVSTYLKNNPDWSKKQALSATYNTVAPAGTSEHQTGLAFDITVPGVSFTGTEQQKWLHAHCHEYGFIVRYTKEKQSITGFIAESWHIRYVGIEAAQIITKNNWCLEEYLQNVGM
ncbi:MAG: D-alanyl-D-alanine carboxypeptidase family protein [Clostridia bacterium]|nr:D-alanyl-D-alanine carboxypeptidase family protein [Clostridia bacterium]